MPLYEYECDACHHRFEVIQQRHSDPPIEECPKCGGPVHKLQSAPAFQFKGSGWYITDYAKKDSGSAKSEDAKSEAKESSSEKSEKGEKGEKGEKSEKTSDASKSAPSKESKESTGSKESKDGSASSATSTTPSKSS
jgi:putative FmdB family regulatory protein